MDNNKTIKISDRIYKILVVLAAILIFLGIALKVVNTIIDKRIENARREQANAKLPAIQKQIDKIIEANRKTIYSIEPHFEYDGVNFVHVYVTDVWFKGTDIEKKRFAMSIRDNIKDILVGEEFIEADDRVGIYVYTVDGILLAEEDMLGQIKLKE